jgi:DNA polymerase-3 subunit alpha
LKGYLYTKSEYSLLNSIIRLEDLVSKAASYNYNFLSLTDTGNFYALFDFFALSKKYNIKPLLGLRILTKINDIETSFLCYPKNKLGFSNLLKLSYLSNGQSKVIDFSKVKSLSSNVIFVTSGDDSSLYKTLLNNDLNEFEKTLLILTESFKDLYIGLSLDNFVFVTKCVPILEKYAFINKIKLLPIHQSLYLNKEDKYAYEVFSKIENENANINGDYHLLTINELDKLFKDYNYVFSNLDDFFKSIDFEYEVPKFNLPKYKNENNISSHEYLKSLSILGLKKRLSNSNKTLATKYTNRLKYELEMINKMNFSDYFLIVFDFIRYAKKNNIGVGPGRGSSVGSLVAYSIGITEVDPVEYNLFFERFLNPARKTMPDIDIDFSDYKRDDVIRYVKMKYGKEHVAQITAFSTFGLKAAIRDIGKVLNIDKIKLSFLEKRIIDNDIDPEDNESNIVLNIIKKIINLPRHVQTHASGIILSDEDLTKTIPLLEGNISFQTQNEAHILEQLGLLKIDFLGLSNITLLDNIINLIPNFDINCINLDDPKTFELLSSTLTDGIFQLESPGMRNVLRKMEPTKFSDIVAVLALFRPGPMEFIDDYINGKKTNTSKNKIKVLDPILNETYGIPIYQEQVMQIASAYASYSLSDADILRRAISKKESEAFANEEKKFITKSIENHKTKEEASQVFNLIKDFASYGFNKSHSVAYALTAYRLAYLKANYYQYFMVCLLNQFFSDTNKVVTYIREIKSNGYKVFGFDINKSETLFSIKDNIIYFPLTLIKSITYASSNSIIDERLNGEFISFNNFYQRTSTFLNKQNYEYLINSCALDNFQFHNHKTMINSLENAMNGFLQFIEEFSGSNEKEDFTSEELTQYEKDSINFNYKYSLLDKYKTIMEQKKIDDIKTGIKKSSSVVIGYITKTRTINTKKNEKMAFVTITDSVDDLDLVLFPTSYISLKDKLDNKNISLFHIKKNMKEGYELQNITNI